MSNLTSGFCVLFTSVCLTMSLPGCGEDSPGHGSGTEGEGEGEGAEGEGPPPAEGEGEGPNGEGEGEGQPGERTPRFRLLGEPVTLDAPDEDSAFSPVIASDGEGYGIAWARVAPRHREGELWFTYLGRDGTQQIPPAKVGDGSWPRIAWNGTSFAIISGNRHLAHSRYLIHVNKDGSKQDPVEVESTFPDSEWALGEHADARDLKWTGTGYTVASQHGMYIESQDGGSDETQEARLDLLTEEGYLTTSTSVYTGEREGNQWGGVSQSVAWNGNESALTWISEGLHLSRFDAQGHLLDTNQIDPVSSSYDHDSWLTWTGTTYGIAWFGSSVPGSLGDRGDRGIMVARTDASGQLLGDALQIYSTSWYPPDAPRVVAYPDGYGVIYYAGGLFFVDVDKNCSTWGTAIPLNSGGFAEIEWNGRNFGVVSADWHPEDNPEEDRDARKIIRFVRLVPLDMEGE